MAITHPIFKKRFQFILGSLMMRKSTLLISSLLSTALLSGCGIGKKISDLLPDNTASYKDSKPIDSLEIPPNFDRSRINDKMAIPNSNSASGLQAASATPSGAVLTSTGTATAPVLPTFNDVAVKSDGKQRWLVVQGSADKVWQSVKAFWQEQNIAILNEKSDLGTMETEWLNQKEYNGRYKYRVRLERVENKVAIYLTQLAVERLANGAPLSTKQREEMSGASVGAEATMPRTAWKAAKADSQQEAEMLQKLAVFISADKNRPLVASGSTATPVIKANLQRNKAGEIALVVNDSVNNTWQTTGNILDRLGFTVEERSRETATYKIRYALPNNESEEEQGFFNSWFGGEKKLQRPEYTLRLQNNGDKTAIIVLDAAGKADKGKAAEQILSVLQEQMS